MDKKREKLADYAHEAWSGWMKYLFKKCSYNLMGEFVMPEWAVERWKRQSDTRYKDLPELEKDSDRAEADRMLKITQSSQEALQESIGIMEQTLHWSIQADKFKNYANQNSDMLKATIKEAQAFITKHKGDG